jgi:hypothetical protein
MATPAVTIVFDKERKLKARHRYVRNAVIQSKKSIQELLSDPFGGFPYILQAVLQPGSTEVISIDRASDLLDIYTDNGGSAEGLQEAFVKVLGPYIDVENKPTQEEQEHPNESSPAAPGGSGDTA